MSKPASLVLLLVAQASAAKLCNSVYSDATCTAETTSVCETVDTDGSCNTETDDDTGVKTYFTATCNTAGDTITKTDYSSADCSGTSTGSATIDGSGACTDLFGMGSTKIEIDCSAGGSDPCFADSTTACRLIDAAVAPAMAYKQCFGDEAPTMAERVPMRALAAGDVVLASPTATTRVIVNQHAAVKKYSSMVTLEHETGSLTLTPDHVVYADGSFQPAGNVGVGALLEPASKVTKISTTTHGIINPLTTSGTILAAGPTGAPVVSSALSEWIADLVLGSTVYPLPYSLASATSYLFPRSVQAFYDAQLEQFFASTSTDLKGLKAAVPAPVALAILAAFDVACVGAFAAWALLGLKGVATLLAVAAIAKSRRAAGKA